MINWSEKKDIRSEDETRVILTAVFNLTRLDMLHALIHETVFVNGYEYKLPKKDLLEFLIDEIEGCVELELEQL